MPNQMTGDIEIWCPTPKMYRVRFKSINGKVLAQTERYNSKARAMNAAKSMLNLLKEPRLVYNRNGQVKVIDKSKLED